MADSVGEVPVVNQPQQPQPQESDELPTGFEPGPGEGMEEELLLSVHEEEPPNYVMFAITFLVIAYSIYKFIQNKNNRRNNAAATAAVPRRVPPQRPRRRQQQQQQQPTNRARKQAETPKEQDPEPEEEKRQDRFYNGGIGSSGGGSGTMVEAPPSNHPDQNSSAAADERRPPNDTRQLVKLLGSSLVRCSGGGRVQTSSAFAESRLVALYFSAHWCPPCKAFTPKLVECYNAIRRAHGPGVFEVVFVSSDRSSGDFEKYAASMPWLAVAYNDALRKKLGGDFGVRSIPTLIIISPVSGKILLREGRAKVAADPQGANFPWGIADSDATRSHFSGGGHSLASPSSPQNHIGLSRRERAALIAERAAQRRKQAKAAASPTSASASASAGKAAAKPSAEAASKSTADADAVVKAVHRDGAQRITVSGITTTSEDVARSANTALCASGAGSFSFAYGSQIVTLTRDATQLTVRVGDDSAATAVDIPKGGVEVHLSDESLCLGPSCLPWIGDPAKPNSGPTEPQALRPGRRTGGPASATPPWLRGDMEAPAGEVTQTGFTRGVFTAEQQARLGVDENGQKTVAKKAEVDQPKKSSAAAAPAPSSTPAATSSRSAELSPAVAAWTLAPQLLSTDFLRPEDEAEDAAAPAKGSSDDYEVPVGVKHITEGMPELSRYLQEAEAHKIPVMVDYYATWCGPCRAIAPFYEELAAIYKGRMVFLKVDCGGRGPGAINQDVKRFAQIQAFPSFHVYSGGEKVGEVRGGRRDELSRLAEQFAAGGDEGGAGKPAGEMLRTAYSVYREDFEGKQLSVIASGNGISSATAKPLTLQKAKKLLPKLLALAEESLFPFETPLDESALQALVDGCLTQRSFWHTPGTALSKHKAGLAEVTRGLAHTVEPGARPWWQLQHVFPLLDLAEAILQHPESHALCSGPAGSKYALHAAILYTSHRFCARPAADKWLSTAIGRATCERLLSCLTLMTAAKQLAKDTVELADGRPVPADAFPWLIVAVNAPSLVNVAQKFVAVLSAADGTDDEPTKVKNYDRLLRDASRLLCNLSALLLRTPLRLKVSAEASAQVLTTLIDVSVEVLVKFQLLGAASAKLTQVHADGQVCALRAACTALVQTNGVFPVHPQTVKDGSYTKTGLLAETAVKVWIAAKLKILKRAMAAVGKANTHLSREAAEQNSDANGKTETQPPSLAQILKTCARDVIGLMMESAPHPGVTTKPFPNPWK